MGFKSKTLWFIALALLAVASRFLPHPPNFTPVIALLLFVGSRFNNKLLACGFAFGILIVSDLMIGTYPGMFWIYISHFLILGLGFLMNSSRLAQVSLLHFGGAVAFFLTSNFTVWATTTMYAKTLDGLVSCYVMGIPFFNNTMTSTIIYGTAFTLLGKLIEDKFSDRATDAAQ